MKVLSASLLAIGLAWRAAADEPASSELPEFFSAGSELLPAGVGDTSGSGYEFGYSAAPIGDINGDGVEDLAIGQPLSGSKKSEMGRLHLLLMNDDRSFSRVTHGDGAPYAFLADGASEAEGDHWGSAVASAGDIDGDGVPDLVVSAPYYSGPDDDAATGRVGVMCLNADGSRKELRWFETGSSGVPATASTAHFGSALSSADLNGDGTMDFAVVASHSGEVVLLTAAWTATTLSASSAVVLTPGAHGVPSDAWTSNNDLGGVQFIGDIDGNDVPDLALGIPGAGRKPGSVLVMLLTPETEVGSWSLLVPGEGSLSAVVGSKHFFSFGQGLSHFRYRSGVSSVSTMLAIGMPIFSSATPKAMDSGGAAIVSLNADGSVGQATSMLTASANSDIIDAGFSTGYSLAWWFDPSEPDAPVLVAGQPFRDGKSKDTGAVVMFKMSTAVSRGEAAAWLAGADINGTYSRAGGEELSFVLASRLLGRTPPAPSAVTLTTSSGALLTCGSVASTTADSGSGDMLRSVTCSLPAGAEAVVGVSLAVDDDEVDVGPVLLQRELPTLDWSSFETVYTSEVDASSKLTLAADLLSSFVDGGLKVTVGGIACTTTAIQSDGELVCEGIPQCAGGDYAVAVVEADGTLVSKAPSALSFGITATSASYTNPPEGYTPPTARIYLGEDGSGAMLRVTGTGFGSAPPSTSTCTNVATFSAAEQLAIEFGDAGSDTWTAGTSPMWKNETTLEVTAPAIDTHTRDLRVTINGASAELLDVIRLMSDPEVTSVDKTEVVSGGALTITGKRFGTSAAGVAVALGGFDCSVTSVTTTQIVCTVGSGRGGGLAVAVTVNGKSNSDGPSVGYALGTVSTISPAYAFLTKESTAVSFTITGTTVDSDLTFLPAVRVAGVACPTVGRPSAASVTCSGLDASKLSLLGGDKSPVAVNVTIGNAMMPLVADFAFSVLGQPEVTDTHGTSVLSSAPAAQTITIHGHGMGHANADVAAVTIGDYDCGSITVTAGTDGTVDTVSCSLTGGGVGANLAVKVKTAGGLWSDTNENITCSFAAPVVTALSPAQAYGAGDYSFTINGTNLGTTVDGVPEVSIGGVNCKTVTVTDSTSLSCDITTTVYHSFGSSEVTVAVGGQTGTASGLLSFVPPPVVLGCNPPVIPTSGFDGLIVFGSSFGTESAAIANNSVTVGGKVCANAMFITPQTVSCDAPAGTGGNVEVAVRTADDISSEPVEAVSYYFPDIVTVQPAYAVAGADSTHEFLLTGTDFGWSQADLEEVSVGGVLCPTTEWVNATAVRCKGLRLGATAGEWPSSLVTVTIDGQKAQQPGLFSGLAAPTVSSVVPPTGSTSGGYTLRVLGNHFGTGIVDVGTVHLGSEQCTDVEFISETELKCTAPAGVGASLEAHVATSGGARGSGGSFGYAPPVIEELTPSTLYSGAVSYDIVITGTSFGNNVGDVRSVLVAESPCRPATWLTPTSILCQNLAPPFVGTSIRIKVGTQVNVQHGLVRIMGEPQVFSMAPSSGPPAANTTVTLAGASFAVSADHIRAVVFGEGAEARLIPRADWSFDPASPGRLSVTLPRGIPAGPRPIRVVQTGFLANAMGDAASFSYDEPVITAVSPSVVVTGAEGATQSFVITGEHLGIDASSIVAVTVAGNPCATVEWKDPTEVVCKGVMASQWADPTSGAVAVELSESLPTAAQQAEVWDAIFPNVTLAAPTAEEGSIDASFEQASLVTVLGMPVVSSVLQVDAQAGSPTSGGTTIRISGANLGANAQDITNVTVGGHVVTSWEWQSSSSLEAVVAAGVGRRLSVEVTNRLGGKSTANQFFSYDEPVIAWVEPASLFAGQTGVDLAITGDNFCGHAAAASIVSAGVNHGASGQYFACSSVELADETCGTLLCSGLSIPAEAAGRLDASVRLRSQLADRLGASDLPLHHTLASSVSTTTGIESIGAPVVEAVTPPTGPIQGGAAVTIRGNNFGSRPGDVVRVAIGGQNCDNFTHVSASLIQAVVPAGTGSLLSVAVETRGGLSSAENHHFSYNPPVVESIEPDYSLTGDLSMDFEITGSQFGLAPGDVQAVRVGGVPCSSWSRISASRIQCLGVAATAWAGNEVEVVVSGQESLPNFLFRPIPAPELLAVSPRLVVPGESILVVGRHFGEVSSDLSNITIDGLHCSNVELVGPTAAKCIVPPARDWRREQAASGNVSALTDINVQVITAGGAASPNRALITYAEAGQPPRGEPDPLGAWRLAGRSGSVQLTWVFPEDDLTDNVPTVAHFAVEIKWQNGSNVDLVDTDVIAVPTTTRRQAQAGFVAYSYALFGAFDHSPVQVRIAAQNEAGQGPFTRWTPAVTETCQKDEYLQTNLPPQSWTCAPCPTGAFCGGLPYDRMVPLAGYWRVPWSADGLDFEECPVTKSCLGFHPPGLGIALDQALQRNGSIPDSLADLEDLFVAGNRQSRRLTGDASTGSFGYSSLSAPEGGGLVYTAGNLRLTLVSSSDSTIAGSIGSETSKAGSDWATTVMRSVPGLAMLVPESSTSLSDAELVVVDTIRERFVAARGDTSGAGEGSSAACDEGYNGVFCTACSDGYARVRVAECMKCMDTSVVWALAILIGLVFVAVISFVIAQAVWSRGLESKPDVIVIKIFITYLQQAALIAWIELEWPAGVVRMLTWFDSVTSLSVNVFSLDCIVPDEQRPAGSLFYFKSLMVLVSPIVMVAVAGLFWLLLALTPARSFASAFTTMSCCNKAKRGPGADRRRVMSLAQSQRNLNLEYQARVATRAPSLITAGSPTNGGGSGAVLSPATPGTEISARMSGEGRADASDKFGLCCSGRILAWRQKWLQSRVVTSVVILAFMLHTAAVKAVLRLFTCTSVGQGADARSHLQYDMAIECSSDVARDWMLGAGLPSFFLYVVGIPAVAAWWLYSRRHALATRAMRRRYGFLYTGCRDGYFFWEPLVMLRKVALSVVLVFLAPAGVAAQTYSALTIFAVAAVIHAYCEPYNRAQLNWLEQGSILVCFFTCVAGMYLSDPLTSHGARVAFTMLIFVINFATVGAFLFRLVGGRVASVRHELRLKNLSRKPTSGPHILGAADRARAKMRGFFRAVVAMRQMSVTLRQPMTMEQAIEAVRVRNHERMGLPAPTVSLMDIRLDQSDDEEEEAVHTVPDHASTRDLFREADRPAADGGSASSGSAQSVHLAASANEEV